MAQEQSRPPGPAPDLRETRRSLPIALLHAREVVMAPIREILAASGISEQRWRVLRVLEAGGPMEQGAVAAEACLQLPSLTRMIRAMEAEGLLTRRTDPRDRRRVIVAIAAAGSAVILDHADESNAILRSFEDKLGCEQIEALLDLLEKLHNLPRRM